MVLDAVIERGNPADSLRLIPMLERHAELYGEAPAQVACDGGYASKANLRDAKVLGVGDMAFHKKRGLDPLEMASSAGVYGRLRRFRAGMEAAISYLKRCFGLRRCNWRSLEHFRAYVWVGHRHAQPRRSRPEQAETQAGVAPAPLERTASGRLARAGGFRVSAGQKNAPEGPKNHLRRWPGAPGPAESRGKRLAGGPANRHLWTGTN